LRGGRVGKISPDEAGDALTEGRRVRITYSSPAFFCSGVAALDAPYLTAPAPQAPPIGIK